MGGLGVLEGGGLSPTANRERIFSPGLARPSFFTSSPKKPKSQHLFLPRPSPVFRRAPFSCCCTPNETQSTLRDILETGPPLPHNGPQRTCAGERGHIKSLEVMWKMWECGHRKNLVRKLLNLTVFFSQRNPLFFAKVVLRSLKTKTSGVDSPRFVVSFSLAFQCHHHDVQSGPLSPPGASFISPHRHRHALRIDRPAA